MLTLMCAEMCDFEIDMCSYKQLASNLHWNYTARTNHAGLPVDHTTGSETGLWVIYTK